MSKIYHMGTCVRGMLRWPKKKLKNAIKYASKNDGTKFNSVDELIDCLMDELSQGHEIIPICECDNWDWKHGCMGHEQVKENPNA